MNKSITTLKSIALNAATVRLMSGPWTRGLAFEMKIDESGKNLEEVYLEKFNFWDIVLDLGIGIEMKLGQNTAFFSGITYYRGLLNAVQPQSFLENDLKVKNDYWALNLGIKF